MFALLTTLLVGQVDVSCYASDCLAYGWLARDRATGYVSGTSCNAPDGCHQSGWVTDFESTPLFDAECKGDGCFTTGWIETYTQNGQLAADVECLGDETGSNCFTHGWTSLVPGRGRFVVECVDNDCRTQGWDVYSRGYRVSSLECKEDACFENGWYVFR